MDFNFHTHTHYCGHAVGEMEEYVQRAMEGGIRYMGFSEHGPFAFPDGYESAHRVPVSKAANYAANIAALQKKHKDVIELHTGYEIEYYPEHFSAMVDTARRLGAEHLILGQHFLYGEHPRGVHAMAATTRTEDLQEYVDAYGLRFIGRPALRDIRIL